MRRTRHVATLAGFILIAPVLAGCADFDMDKLDVFGLNEKKKLPGERKELFPGGVPGVAQGIPPEYMKGYQPPPEAATPTNEPDKKTASTEEEAKPKPARKPKPRTPAPASTKITVGGSQGGGQQQQTPWPQDQQQAAPQQQPTPQPSQSPWPTQGQTNAAAPWPSSPSPGTFSR